MAEMGGQNVVGITIPAFVVPSAKLTFVTFVTLVGCGWRPGSPGLIRTIISLEDTAVNSYVLYTRSYRTIM